MIRWIRTNFKKKQMKTKTMLLRLPNDLNEELLDEVAKRRKLGIPISKEDLIIEILTSIFKP